MPAEWTLSINGTTQTLAAWGILAVRLTKSNLVADQLTFIRPIQHFDDDELCEHGDEIELFRDGVRWFWGTRQLSEGQALANTESQQYLAVGPWRWLAENPYQQGWATLYTSHVIVNSSIGANIRLLLDYAIANGAHLQYIQAELDALSIFPPANESTGQLCDHIIAQNLQFSPDVIAWFDYTTDAPTLHFTPRASLTDAGVRLASYTANEALPIATINSLRARPDLQLPSVKINFETIVTIDDREYMIPSVDIYPLSATGREDGVFTDTVTLRGRTENNVFAELDCVQIPNLITGAGAPDAATEAWLEQHINSWQDGRTHIGAILSVRRLDEQGNPLPIVYGRELPPGGGIIAPWMRLADASPVSHQREFFEVIADFYEYDHELDTDPVKVTRNKMFRFEITTTDAPAGISSYTATESIDFGDQPITGLAQFLYNALNPLQYEAVLELHQDECDAYVDLGTVLNLYGSRAAYETMRAVVQGITFDIDAGRTTITCGPPRHLTLGDLLALHQRFRVNRRWTNPDLQETGELGGSDEGNLELGTAAGNTNALPGAGVVEHLVIKTSGDTDDEKYVRLSMDDIEDDWTKKNIKLRRVTMCIRNAQGISADYYVIVPMSEPWPIS